MKNPEHIISGIRQVLYGQLQSGKMEQFYKTSIDRDWITSFWEMPGSPKAYLNLIKPYSTHWQGLDGLLKEAEWIDPYFSPYPLAHKSFHPLCRFYRNFTECEYRLIISEMTKWQEKLEITLLKYSLVTIQRELVNVVKEAAERVQYKSLKDQQAGKLENYVYETLLRMVAALLQDIQLRFRMCIGDWFISPEKLYEIYLEMEVPDQPVIYRTTDGTLFEIESTAPEEGANKLLETLMLRLHDEIQVRPESEIPTEILESRSILENAWFVSCLKSEDETGRCPEARDADKNRSFLEELHRQLNTGSVSSGDLQQIIDAANSIAGVQKSEEWGRSSAAGKVISEVLGVLEQEMRTVQPINDTNEQKDGVPKIGVLGNYIPYDELKDKLDVTDVTFKKYLEEAGIDIVKFSQKMKFIHSDSVKKLMNHFTTNNQSKTDDEDE